AQQYVPRSKNLALHDGLGQRQRAAGLTGGVVLNAPQQHVARGRPLKPGTETPTATHPHHLALIFGTAVQQERTDKHVAEEYESTHVVQRHPQQRRTFGLYTDGLVVQVQVSALSLYEERVQELADHSTSILLRRPDAYGIQASMS